MYFAFSALLAAVILSPFLVAIIEPFFLRQQPNPPSCQTPLSATVIVSAYLPNEQGIIVETISYLLRELRYSGELEIIVVYNTPTDLPVERQLRAFATTDHRVRLLKAIGSDSKAQNLNLAVSAARGTVIAFFDADARPEPDALERAARWIDAGYDFVQGANVIRHSSASLLARLVAVEFAEKYQVTYLSRYRSASVCYFSGSNGYWNRNSIGTFRFDPSVFVEDIHSSLALGISGSRYFYDPTIKCTELAPPTWPAWWGQRMRWAKGWVELLKGYQRAVLAAPWTLVQKAYWTYFLAGRRLFVPASLLAIGPAVVVGAPVLAPKVLVLLVAAALAFAWAAALCQALAVATFRDRYEIGRFDVLTYTVLFPLYDSLRLITTVAALYSQGHGWTVTPRESLSRSACGANSAGVRGMQT